MSIAYYIALENDDVEFNAFVNGKAIAHASDSMSELCEKNGITPLERFLSQDVSELLDDFEVSEGMGDSWFDAKEGIECINSIIELISKSDCDFDKDPVIIDLNEYLVVLYKVKKENIKWRLELDI